MTPTTMHHHLSFDKIVTTTVVMKRKKKMIVVTLTTTTSQVTIVTAVAPPTNHPTTATANNHPSQAPVRAANNPLPQFSYHINNPPMATRAPGVPQRPLVGTNLHEVNNGKFPGKKDCTTMTNHQQMMKNNHPQMKVEQILHLRTLRCKFRSGYRCKRRSGCRKFRSSRTGYSRKSMSGRTSRSQLRSEKILGVNPNTHKAEASDASDTTIQDHVACIETNLDNELHGIWLIENETWEQATADNNLVETVDEQPNNKIQEPIPPLLQRILCWQNRKADHSHLKVRDNNGSLTAISDFIKTLAKCNNVSQPPRAKTKKAKTGRKHYAHAVS